MICIAGMPLAGKTTATKAAKELGIEVVSMGDSVRAEAKRRGLDTTPETMARLFIELRRERGPHAVAELVSKYIIGKDLIIVEGVRSLHEIEYFKKKFGDVILITVHASPMTRFKRALRRGRRDDPKTFEEFISRDYRELKEGLGWVIALSDYMIINESTKDELINKTKELLSKVVKDDP